MSKARPPSKIKISRRAVGIALPLASSLALADIVSDALYGGNVGKEPRNVDLLGERLGTPTTESKEAAVEANASEQVQVADVTDTLPAQEALFQIEVLATSDFEEVGVVATEANEAVAAVNEDVVLDITPVSDGASGNMLVAAAEGGKEAPKSGAKADGKGAQSAKDAESDDDLGGYLPLAAILGGLGIAAAAGGGGGGSAPVDSTPPRATITLDKAILAAGETATVTITFTEPVSGFVLSDLVAANGTLSNLVQTDNALIWTATFTPTADVEDLTNTVTLAAGSYTDAAGNAGVDATSDNYVVATEVRFVIDGYIRDAQVFRDLNGDGEWNDGEPIVRTNEFGAFSGLGGTGGTIIAIGGTDISTELAFEGVLRAPAGSAVINPITTLISAALGDTTGKTPDEIATDLAAAEAKVAALLGLDPSIGSLTQIDPIASATGGGANADTFVALQLAAIKAANILVTLNQTLVSAGAAAGPAQAADILNEALGELIRETPNGGTLDLSSAQVIKTLVEKAADKAVAEGSANTAASATLKGVAQEVANTVSNVNQVIDKIDKTKGLEALKEGVATQLVITGAGGVLTKVVDIVDQTKTFVTDQLGDAPTDDAVAQVIQFVTTAVSNQISVGFDQESIESQAADNLMLGFVEDVSGSGQDENLPVDITPPTVKIVLTNSILSPGDSTKVTLTFSESITGLALNDLSVSAGSGTLSDLQQSPSDSKVWTATFTAATDLTASEIEDVITLRAGGVRDLSRNPNQETASDSFVVDSSAPRALITLDKGSVIAGETVTVTITFTEAVKDFELTDLFATNGTFSDLESADGIVWTATFTPQEDVQDLTSAVKLAAGSYAAAAGNLGTAATSDDFAIDTKLPTATINLDKAILIAGETATVTITFSEAVKDFTADDLVVESGTITDPESSDGKVWTAKFTASTSLSGPSVSNAIFLKKDSDVRDLAGNPGSAIPSADYAVLRENTVLEWRLSGLPTPNQLEITDGFGTQDFSATGPLAGWPGLDKASLVAVNVGTEDDAQFSGTADSTVTLATNLGRLASLGIDYIDAEDGITDVFVRGAYRYDDTNGRTPEVNAADDRLGFFKNPASPAFDPRLSVGLGLREFDDLADGANDGTVILNASLRDLSLLGIDYVTRIGDPSNFNTVTVKGAYSEEDLDATFGGPTFNDTLSVRLALTEFDDQVDGADDGTVTLKTSLQQLADLGIDRVLSDKATDQNDVVGSLVVSGGLGGLDDPLEIFDSLVAPGYFSDPSFKYFDDPLDVTLQMTDADGTAFLQKGEGNLGDKLHLLGVDKIELNGNTYGYVSNDWYDFDQLT